MNEKVQVHIGGAGQPDSVGLIKPKTSE